MKHPLCEVCQRPMVGGQNRRHGVCDPNHPAYVRPDPYARAIAESQRSADARWTPAQQVQVDAAIRTAATRFELFTADQVWQLLPADFPITKGLAARLNCAARAGVIRNSGQTAIANRGGKHDHAQRLTVWASLICVPTASLFAEQGTGR